MAQPSSSVVPSRPARKADESPAPSASSPWGLVLILLSLHVALICGSTIALRQTGVMVVGNELGLDNAWFLAVSTGTLSGFQQVIGLNDFNPENLAGPIIITALTVSATLLTLICTSVVAARILRFKMSDWQIVVAAVVMQLLAIMIGTAALMGDLSIFHSLNLAASAFGNCGSVVVGSDAPLAFGSIRAQCVLLPLAVVGGIGLPVILDLWQKLVLRNHHISNHTRTAIGMSAAVYVAGVGLLLVSTSHEAGWRQALLISSTNAINTRSAGLPFDTIKRSSKPEKYALMTLMAVGACPGGAGGGLKVTTISLLLFGCVSIVRGKPVRRSVGIAGAWFLFYLAVAIVGVMALSAVESKLSADNIFFLVVSSLSNVGLSEDRVALRGVSSGILTVLMIVGRLAPLGVLAWIYHVDREADVLVA